MKFPLLALCLLAIGTSACGGAADIPSTPDLTELLQSYDHPTASLDETSAAQALGANPSLKELAAGLDSATYIMGDFDEASTSSSGSSGSRLRVQGSVEVHVRCPGELGEPNYDESVNGSISFTLALADNRIRRSFGGEAKSCVLQGSIVGRDARVVLDGKVAFDLGRDVGIGQRWAGELLAFLPGELTVAGIEFKSISARRTAAGRWQHLVVVDGGTIVFEVGDDGVTIRDGSGVWFCAEGQPCARN